MSTEKEKVKKDRSHNQTGLQPKKGGAGGKGTWGVGAIDDLKQTSEDKHDPNFDSDEEEIVLAKTELVSPFVAILQEYLVSGDLEEAAKSLKELETADKLENFIKKALVLGFENKAYERELISKLLSDFYNKVVPADKIALGFQITLDSLEDLVLDTPDVADVLSKFLARAIVDEIVAPAFLNNAITKSKLADEVLALATGLTTEKHRIDRLAHIWGPGDLSSVKRLKEEVNLLLQEYLTNGDAQEADKSVRKLNAPSFHFQLVKQAIRLALQSNSDQRKQISTLLNFFSQEGLISTEHIEKGFKMCFATIKDISLDIPNAESSLHEFVNLAQKAGYLATTFKP